MVQTNETIKDHHLSLSLLEINLTWLRGERGRKTTLTPQPSWIYIPQALC